jgi:hypothetical protein
MLTTGKLLIRARGILRVLCAIGLLLLPLLGEQQPKDAAPPAPVPTPIARAKKVFIANAPGDRLHVRPPVEIGDCGSQEPRPAMVVHRIVRESRDFRIVRKRSIPTLIVRSPLLWMT